MVKNYSYPQEDDSYNKFYEQYKDKIKTQLGDDSLPPLNQKVISKEYLEFKDQYMPKHFSIYEKACNISEKIIKIAPDKNKARQIHDSLEICHLNVTPTGVVSFSILFPIIYIILGVLLTTLISALFLAQGNMFFIMFFLISGVVMIFPLTNLPFILANNWRLKASNQMVLCIFYIVSYMRHTSNFEMAVKFTADHIDPPLSLDLKKVLWNVETEKYESLKESFEEYLKTWTKWNMEFVESIHLIESSLYEPVEERRIEALEKALSLILEETYEKMLHYAHDLKSPLTMLHMLGIILPILGLVILPLVISFMENVQWYHIALLYNVALPIGVFYLGKIILSKRPTGYGETEITEKNPQLSKYKNIIFYVGNREIKISPLMICILIFSLLFLIGISPLIIHQFDTTKTFDVVVDTDWKIKPIHSFQESRDSRFTLLGYKPSKMDSTDLIGPFGIGASVLSLFVPLSLGLGIGLYYKMTTKNLIKIREKSKELEAEFAAALFQLGNRIGDGIPGEIAFGKVADLVKDTTAGKFFELVSMNISKFGFGVQKAIFDKNHGALQQFPSKIIESSMKIFIESAKKGPKIASQALINISLYIKEIHKVDERLKDLMAEIISSMTSQINFLTPAISGIVIGITSMLTTILTKLTHQITDLSSGAGGLGGADSAIALMELFGDSVPTFFFQIIVGVYVVQIVYILTILVNSIQNGVDKLNERNMLGKTIPRALIMYSLIACVIMLIFNLVAGMVMTGFGM
ncbi:hypothetical protein JXB41_02095 [Candidatus Woesearchaeota archaeon]|nr:hypothetical protein [Candidatus Woesearchaeota archaeon]